MMQLSLNHFKICIFVCFKQNKYRRRKKDIFRVNRNQHPVLFCINGLLLVYGYVMVKSSFSLLSSDKLTVKLIAALFQFIKTKYT